MTYLVLHWTTLGLRSQHMFLRLKHFQLLIHISVPWTGFNLNMVQGFISWICRSYCFHEIFWLFVQKFHQIATLVGSTLIADLLHWVAFDDLTLCSIRSVLPTSYLSKLFWMWFIAFYMSDHWFRAKWAYSPTFFFRDTPPSIIIIADSRQNRRILKK